MPGAELLNWIGQGSSVVMAVIVIGFLQGWILSRKAHEEQMAVLRQQVAEAQEREAEIWELLKGVTGLTMETASIAKRSTRVAEAQTQQGTWVAAQARLERPRRPRTPKEPPP